MRVFWAILGQEPHLTFVFFDKLSNWLFNFLVPCKRSFPPRWFCDSCPGVLFSLHLHEICVCIPFSRRTKQKEVTRNAVEQRDPSHLGWLGAGFSSQSFQTTQMANCWIMYTFCYVGQLFFGFQCQTSSRRIVLCVLVGRTGIFDLQMV